MTKQALYLKWRPQTFDDLIGQEHVTRTLLNSIQKERIRHAYLFSGPRGTGKTTTARLLAHALGSQNMDLIEIDAASHTGVDDVRDLRDKVQFMPAEGQYKVYIIDEVHRFSGSAFDALLKTLEEPPEHAIFVLATTEIDKVPDTIKSRCLQFEFRRVALREVADRLQMIADAEGLNIDRDALELVARYGTGSVRDSISLLDQIVADPGEHITLALAQKILGTANNEAVEHLAAAALTGDAVAGLRVINEAVDSGSDPRQFGQQVVEHLRYVLLAQTASADLIDASDEMRAVYSRHAELVDKATLLRAVRAFNDAVNDQRSGWQPQLSLELALLDSVQGREAASAGMGTAPVAQLPADLDAHIERIVEARLASLPAVPAGKAKSRGSAKAVPPQATAEDLDVKADLKAPGVLPISAIQAKWNEVKGAVKSKSTTLPALLEHVSPQSINGNVVTLAANNAFFEERVSTSENKSLLNFVLSRLHGETLKVRVVRAGEVSNTSAGSSATFNADDPLMQAARDLGAEISPADDE